MKIKTIRDIGLDVTVLYEDGVPIRVEVPGEVRLRELTRLFAQELPGYRLDVVPARGTGGRVLCILKATKQR